MYTEVIPMKKTESVTYRTDPQLKKILLTIAAEKKWTLSFVIEEIIKDWLKDHKDNAAKL